jgi:gliding-associated putative ABC transporter substrate-binding component GldG
MAMNKRTRTATESLLFLGVVAGILVALNVLGMFFFGRIDVTEKRLFSLSNGSKRVVQNLDDQLEVTAYFTKDLPPPFNATERYVRDLLDEYQAAAKGKLKVRFVNPDSDEARSNAESDGVQRVAHQKVENDAVQVVEGYRGVVFKYLGGNKAIPTISGTEGLEYDFTQTIKELTGEKVKLGVLAGHEGPSLAQGLSVLKKLLPTYELVEVQATADIDQNLRALLLIGPETPLTDEELRNIDAYVMKGGSLGVFGGTLKIKQDQGALTGSPVQSGVNTLLEKWGVKMNDGILADAQCRQVPMRTQFGISIPVPFPPIPVISLDEQQAKHPVAYRLNQTMLPFGSTLKETGALKNDKAVKITVLGKSSKSSWLITGTDVDLKPREPDEWNATVTEPRGPFPIAMAIEGKLPSAFRAEAVSSVDGAAPQGPKGPARAEKDVHVFVLGSSGLVRDDFLPPVDRVEPAELSAQVALALNAIDWLAQEDELIAVRAKNVEEPLIEVPSSVRAAEDEARAAAKEGDQGGTEQALEKRKAAIEDWDAKKARFRWLNISAMPLLFVGFGLVRWQVRKKKRASLKL